MRLIDADEIRKKAVVHTRGDYGYSADVRKWAVLVGDIDDAPTIDAIPVVRCGECERRNKSADLTDTIYCPWLKLQMRKTDFCSYGERKEDNPNVNHNS